MEYYLDYDMSYADDLDDDFDLDEQYSHSHTHLDYARDMMCMVICANTHEIMHEFVAHIHSTYAYRVKTSHISCNICVS